MKTSHATLAAVAALLSGSAFAADLPSVKGPPPLVPPPPPAWTGFYFGANVGGIFDGSPSVQTGSAPFFNDVAGNSSLGFATFFGNAAAASIPGFASFNDVGVIGGGQVGFNWQFTTSFVASIEADIQGSSLSGTANGFGAANEAVTGAAVITTTTTTKTTDWLGTVRGRLGYLVTPTLLVFGSAGLAYGDLKLNNAIFHASPTSTIFAPFATNALYNDTQIGWTVGGGAEWMFYNNWSAKIEYLYYDLGSVSAATATTGLDPINGAQVYGVFSQSSSRFNGHIVRAGLNYHFRWFAPTPVVAKY
jgi:outer membrane immunogenic protein